MDERKHWMIIEWEEETGPDGSPSCGIKGAIARFEATEAEAKRTAHLLSEAEPRIPLEDMERPRYTAELAPEEWASLQPKEVWRAVRTGIHLGTGSKPRQHITHEVEAVQVPSSWKLPEAKIVHRMVEEPYRGYATTLWAYGESQEAAEDALQKEIEKTISRRDESIDQAHRLALSCRGQEFVRLGELALMATGSGHLLIYCPGRPQLGTIQRGQLTEQQDGSYLLKGRKETVMARSAAGEGARISRKESER